MGEGVKNMSLNFDNTRIREHMLDGQFGLEKESLRVTVDGYLAHTKHPFGNDPHMERDFCENQTELITGVCDSIDAVWKEMAGLHKKAVKILFHLESGREFLWPFSNPPYVKGEEDIHIASYHGILKGKERYRRYLAEKYGKKKMFFSGIHFNYSFPESILKEGYRESNASTFRQYKDQIYMELAKKITRYSWLLVYLTAASPVLDGSFFEDDARGKTIIRDYGSARCSEIGYWNDFVPLLDYKNLETYVSSIEEYIEQGQLKEAAELYYPVRLKPAGENSLNHLREKGVNHIELRVFDLNPLSPVGIMKEDLQFIHLFLLYLMSLEDREFESFEQMMAIKNEKRAARYEERRIWIETGWSTSMPVRDAALHVLFGMEQFFQKFGGAYYRDVMEYQKRKLIHPEYRYVVAVREEYQKEYVEQGLELARRYAEGIDEERI